LEILIIYLGNFNYISWKMLSSGEFVSSSEIPGLNVFITLDDKTFNVIIGPSVGYGGTKRAYKITDDSVILLPSRGLLKNYTSTNWKNIVNNEVNASKLLTLVGLHNPQHEHVTLSVPQYNIVLETYISKSFDGFGKLGMYVMDLKNIKYSSPSVFYDDNIDLYDMSNWNEIFSELVHDIIIMFTYKLDYRGDSMNLISVRSENISLISPFKIRYFGFDFPSGITNLPRTWKIGDMSSKNTFLLYRHVISIAAENVLFAEIDKKTGTQNISLSDDMYKLVYTITKYFDPILEELYMKNSIDYQTSAGDTSHF
jgi:hypothetical protein